jgi:hypothetical protein
MAQVEGSGTAAEIVKTSRPVVLKNVLPALLIPKRVGCAEQSLIQPAP